MQRALRNRAGSPGALIELLGWIRDAGIDVWLDGGWGVDALLETQSRAHKDVDLIVALTDVESLTRLLTERGYHVKEGGRAENFVLANDTGREVDVLAVYLRRSLSHATRAATLLKRKTSLTWSCSSADLVSSFPRTCDVLPRS